MKRTILNRNIKQNRPAAMMVSMCCAVGAILLTGLFVIKFSLSGSFDLNYPVIDGPCMTIASDNSDEVKNISEMLKRQDAAAHVILYDRCVTKGVTIAGRNYPFAYVFSGDSLVIAENEVYVNNSVVDISPGETVLFNSEKEPYLVKGVINDPVNAAPDVMNTVLYVDGKVFDRLKEYGTNREGVLYIYSDRPDDTNALAMDYLASCEEKFEGSVHSYEDIKSDYLFRYQIIGEYLMPVTVVVICFVILLAILLTNVMLVNDMKTIEIYRAIGMSKRRVAGIYLFQFTELTFAGALSGTVIGILVLKIWFSGMYKALGPFWFVIDQACVWMLMSILVMMSGVLAAVLVTICFVLAEGAKEYRGNSASTKLHVRPFSESNKAFGVSAVVGLSYGMLYKRQTVIAAFSSLFMGSLTLFSIFLCAGVLNRNDHLAEWGIADMDIYVSRTRNVDERESGLLEYLDESASVDYYYAAMSDTVFYKTENASGSIMADIYNDQILPNMHVSIVEGHDPDNHDEIAVGMRFAKLNDVVIGDVLEITHGNDTRCMTVSGIYSSFKQYSESVRFPVDDIVTYFDNNADGYYSIVLEGGAVTDAVINELQQKFPDYRFIPMKRGYMNTLINMAAPVLLIVFMCLIVFMFIIRVLLSLFITDRQEALKTYMHVGFSKMNVCKIVRYSILPTVLCAVLLAIPCATIIVPGLFKGVAMELGLSSVPLNTSIVTILAGVLVIVLSARFVFRRRNIIDVLR